MTRTILPVPARLLLLGIGACTSETQESGRTADVPDLNIHWSEVIPTVATVDWDSTLADGFIEFSADGATWRRIAASPGEEGQWEAVVVGMRSSATYLLRVGGSEEGEETVSAPIEATTGAAPPSLPELLVVADAVTNDPGLLGLGLIGTTNWGVFVDADGQIVWWYPNPYDGRLTTRIVPSRDGRSVYMNVARSLDAESLDDFAILQVAWDGTLLATIETSVHHHDFLELPSGELAWLSDESRDVDGEPVHGDTVVVRSADGTQRILWNAWDAYDYADFAPQHDFVHANALQFDEPTGTLWIGLRNANQLLQLDPDRGTVLKRVFGMRSDYPLTVGSKPDGQHNFTVLPGGLLIHDNQDSTDLPSRLVEYTLSGDPGHAEQVWEYTSPEAYDVIGLGDAIRLSTGESLAIWSSAGVIDRVGADGVLTSSFAAGLGTAFGYGAWIDELQPALATN
ncbi:hypothetical protein LBMAG42_28990 [Deltaproteobacteria bacterium]|nr:hypothetical protein LBMAG42_28990 [Deltaproteobacteria bacterium]